LLGKNTASFIEKELLPNAYLAMSRHRPTGECNVFKIKSGGFTYVIRSSGSDRRLTKKDILHTLFWNDFRKNIKIFYDNNVKSIDVRIIILWYAHLSYQLNSTD